jgi:hypothetical protein
VHAFRHVVVHEVEAVTGRASAAAAFLGHDRSSVHGTTGVYTIDATFEEAADVAAACYGWPGPVADRAAGVAAAGPPAGSAHSEGEREERP